MNRSDFRQLASTRHLLLDGATGTHLQAAGMAAGISPEIWVLEHPEVLENLQGQYLAAGSNIILTATFGANRMKMARHHASENIEQVNRQLAALSVQIRDRFRQENPDRLVLVAGDLGPTGSFLYPAGDLTLGEMTDIFREQVLGQLAGGVDLFLIETMMDLAEVRSAVMAVQSECDLPILASLTFAENGRTLAGNSFSECLITLAALGVDACGINCSFGPEKLGELIEPMRILSPIPLLLKPNAGLPVLIDGQTVFPMQAQPFAKAMKDLAADPVRLLGGCCGTGPSHLAALADVLASDKKVGQLNLPMLPDIICSARQTWQVVPDASLPAIDCHDPDSLVDDVIDVIDDEPPAVIIDFDCLPPDTEPAVILEALQQLQVTVAVPLVFRTNQEKLLEQLLRHYCGRAGVIGKLPPKANGALSVNPEKHSPGPGISS
ncbi:MAG TPA: hypothetical protein DCM45_06630 [Clostridiales bacterium]|nr:hypothetical protein [Clostridiales bacterium]